MNGESLFLVQFGILMRAPSSPPTGGVGNYFAGADRKIRMLRIKAFMRCNIVRSFLYLSLILFFGRPTIAEQLVASQQFDHARAIRVVGNTAYTVAESGLFIYDVTDRARPRLRSSLLINDNTSFDLELSPPNAYVLSGETLSETPTVTVVNIGARKPFIVSQFQKFQKTQVKDFILRGDTLIVANANGLEFLSVSDPRNIRRVSTLNVIPKGTVQSLIRDGSVIFASYRSSKRSGFVAVETSTPNSPKIISRTSFTGDEDGPPRIELALSNHVLYVSKTEERVTIYDVNDPKDPKTGGTMSVVASGLYAESNFLFTQTADDRVASFEISNPLSPRFVREVEWSGTTTGMDFDTTQLNAFVQWTELGRAGLAILKFNNDGTYTLQSSAVAIYGSDVEAVNGVTFITGSNKLAAIQKVPGRKTVRELGNIAFFESLQSMEIRNSRGYLATVDSELKPGIQIVDVSDPAHMQARGNLELTADEVPPESRQPRFDVQQDLLVVALRKTGLGIYDVSDGSFQQVSIFDIPQQEQSLNVTIHNDIVFLCTRRGNELNLYVIDVQNRNNPTLIEKLTNFDTGNDINDLKVDGDFLYVTGKNGSGKLYIFSIATVARPVLLSTRSTGSNTKSAAAEEIKIASDRAYIADGSDGITVFNISNKSNPQRVTALNTPSFASGVSIDGQNQIHIADLACYLLFR
jgi:hypothetical protein